MYLKSIVLKGFKSFPDRTRLDFAPGVSVIVGPNGSGKSNITDAVLWALGEQSPLAVRGQSMQDVIFGGSPGRPAARAAEVELVLDDSEGSLGLGTPEVSILRRLERSGEGEYRLAGARCRLIDVLELLSETGLGKEMHSVISQGRVEAIVNSKPRERRLLIEEAAGLGKHRKRRRRAELKLARTQDNLDRALDVEREARSHLRPLKRQAEAADLHARLERQMHEVGWELARDEACTRGRTMQAAAAAAAEARSRQAAIESDIQSVAVRRQAAEEKLAQRTAVREELSRRVFTAQSVSERISLRIETAQAAGQNLEGRLARVRSLVARLEEEAKADAPDEQAAARISALEAALDALGREREAELERQLASLEAQGAQVDALSAECAGRVQGTAAERREAEQALERARAAAREAEREVEAARREAARVGAELAAVNQFLRSHPAVRGGARMLAQEVEVEAGYELAVAAALDGRLAAALAPDRESAEAWLDRDEIGGRALILPSGDEPRFSDADPVSPPVAGAQRLAEKVRGSGAAPALARELLRATWVVVDLDALPPGFAGVAVTMAGRVWAPQARELRQVAAVGEQRVLSERNRRQALMAATAGAAEAEQRAGQALEAAVAEVSRGDERRERAVQAHRAAVRSHDDALEQRRRLDAAIERRRSAPDEGAGGERRAQLQAQLAAERAVLERAERGRTDRLGRLRDLHQALARDEAAAPALARALAALRCAAAAVSEQHADFEAALSADRQESEHVTATLRECAQQEAELHGHLHRCGEELTEREVALQRGRDRLEEVTRELAELAGRLELSAAPAPEPLDDQARETARLRLERLARRREQLGPVNPLAAQEYAEAVEHVEELERQRVDLETAMRELEKLISDTDRQIREAFDAMFESAASNFSELAGQLFPGGSGRLTLVSEREGPARVLGAQDEESGQEDPEGELEAPGEADLPGVEIEVTPAGKAMKRLSLLSGGEKSMTALAFLFAVFLARPCPFYVLDEVEAALDDLNISRFLDLLRLHCHRAQFVVVTHQKRTMEVADALYGVSMAADGISKVISRRMDVVAAA